MEDMEGQIVADTLLELVARVAMFLAENPHRAAALSAWLDSEEVDDTEEDVDISLLMDGVC